jgi:hypothetical protein
MITTNLPAKDRPTTFYRYKVSGTGLFPVDMLRYDGAYPASSEAVSAMGTGKFQANVERRTVELCSYRPPTNDRWASFGWMVEVDHA